MKFQRVNKHSDCSFTASAPFQPSICFSNVNKLPASPGVPKAQPISSAFKTQSLQFPPVPPSPTTPPPTLLPRGIRTLLLRCTLKLTNKQPSDVYIWTTSLWRPPEREWKAHLHCRWEESETSASGLWWSRLYLGKDGNITDKAAKANIV